MSFRGQLCQVSLCEMEFGTYSSLLPLSSVAHGFLVLPLVTAEEMVTRLR